VKYCYGCENLKIHNARKGASLTPVRVMTASLLVLMAFVCVIKNSHGAMCVQISDFYSGQQIIQCICNCNIPYFFH